MKRKLYLMFLLTCSVFAQTPSRYVDSIFTIIQTDTNRIYATVQELNSPYAGESSTHTTNLKMHIFQPQGDTLNKRPMLICIHGGGFVSGNKEHDDMLAFCRKFAAKGYVTATIQYRLGMNFNSVVSGERAVYRALQDCRAVVRYVKEFAVQLKIDTNNVYLLGSSAGAFMCLHNIFLNKENERPAGSYLINNFPPTLDNGPDLGGLDAVASNYIHNAHPRAIIPLWGALKDTTLIELSDSTAPVFLVHGTADNIVPFNYGPPFGYPTLPSTFGSNLIKKRLTTNNFKNETYFVQGAGHEFYGVQNGMWNPAPNAYWDTVLNKVTNFMYKVHKPTAAFSYTVNNGQVTFTNKSVGSTKWKWNFGDGQTSTLQNPVHNYTSNGQFTVKLISYNIIDSWDTVSAKVTITTVEIEETEANRFEFKLSDNYPNPFNPRTKIQYSLAGNQHVQLIVYNILGGEVSTLVNQVQSSGEYEIEFNASTLPSGTYIYCLTAGQFRTFKKLLLLK